MKAFLFLPALCLGLSLTGCASAENKLVLEPVGPTQPQQDTTPKTTGKLLVYSAFEAKANFSGSDPDKKRFSDYKIFTTEGVLLEKVSNETRSLIEEPAEVMLPAGSYQIVARSNGYGLVTVPIKIAANQTTAVHLEGGSWGGKEVQNSTNVVKLPNGQIVGWKSGIAAQAHP